MSVIKKLKNNIDDLKKFISELNIEVEEKTSDFSLTLKKDSLVNQLEDIQHQLYLENLKREKEIVQIRLLGNSASYGNLPLEFVGGITSNISKSIFSTSKYLEYGRKGGKKREGIIRETINLRFEGIGKGSTIFYISGNTSPDLFGNSILQNSLENTFEFLNSPSPEQITENVTNVGARSLKYISKFLNELIRDDLECDLKWDSPDDKKFVWQGRFQNIAKLKETLSKLEISEPEEIEFEGELITISAKGKFEIKTSRNQILFGTFSNDLLPKMQKFHIKQSCKGIISKTKIYNPATDKEKVEYCLTEIF